MKYFIPADLTDPMMRDSERIPHGEAVTIDALALEMERRRLVWEAAHPGWSFTKSTLVKCEDGSPPPAYDVVLGYHRPRTPEEKKKQEEDRERYVAQKDADYARREEDQKALLAQVLQSLNSKPNPE